MSRSTLSSGSSSRVLNELPISAIITSCQQLPASTSCCLLPSCSEQCECRGRAGFVSKRSSRMVVVRHEGREVLQREGREILQSEGRDLLQREGRDLPLRNERDLQCKDRELLQRKDREVVPHEDRAITSLSSRRRQLAEHVAVLSPVPQWQPIGEIIESSTNHDYHLSQPSASSVVPVSDIGVPSVDQEVEHIACVQNKNNSGGCGVHFAPGIGTSDYYESLGGCETGRNTRDRIVLRSSRESSRTIVQRRSNEPTSSKLTPDRSSSNRVNKLISGDTTRNAVQSSRRRPAKSTDGFINSASTNRGSTVRSSAFSRPVSRRSIGRGSCAVPATGPSARRGRSSGPGTAVSSSRRRSAESRDFIAHRGRSSASSRGRSATTLAASTLRSASREPNTHRGLSSAGSREASTHRGRSASREPNTHRGLSSAGSRDASTLRGRSASREPNTHRGLSSAGSLEASMLRGKSASCESNTHRGLYSAGSREASAFRGLPSDSREPNTLRGQSSTSRASTDRIVVSSVACTANTRSDSNPSRSSTTAAAVSVLATSSRSVPASARDVGITGRRGGSRSRGVSSVGGSMPRSRATHCNSDVEGTKRSSKVANTSRPISRSSVGGRGGCSVRSAPPRSEMLENGLGLKLQSGGDLGLQSVRDLGPQPGRDMSQARVRAASQQLMRDYKLTRQFLQSLVPARMRSPPRWMSMSQLEPLDRCSPATSPVPVSTRSESPGPRQHVITAPTVVGPACSASSGLTRDQARNEVPDSTRYRVPNVCAASVKESAVSSRPQVNEAVSITKGEIDRELLLDTPGVFSGDVFACAVRRRLCSSSSGSFGERPANEPSQLLSTQRDNAADVQRSVNAQSLPLMDFETANVDLQSSLASQSSSIDANHLSTIAQQSSSIALKSTSTVQQPSPMAQQYSIIAHQSSSNSQQSSLIAHQSSSNSQPSSLIAHQSSSNSQQSSLIGHRNSTTAQQSSPISQQSSITSQQPSKVSQQPFSMSLKVSTTPSCGQHARALPELSTVAEVTEVSLGESSFSCQWEDTIRSDTNDAKSVISDDCSYREIDSTIAFDSNRQRSESVISAKSCGQRNVPDKSSTEINSSRNKQKNNHIPSTDTHPNGPVRSAMFIPDTQTPRSAHHVSTSTSWGSAIDKGIQVTSSSLLGSAERSCTVEDEAESLWYSPPALSSSNKAVVWSVDGDSHGEGGGFALGSCPGRGQAFIVDDDGAETAAVNNIINNSNNNSKDGDDDDGWTSPRLITSSQTSALTPASSIVSAQSTSVVVNRIPEGEAAKTKRSPPGVADIWTKDREQFSAATKRIAETYCSSSESKLRSSASVTSGPGSSSVRSSSGLSASDGGGVGSRLESGSLGRTERAIGSSSKSGSLGRTERDLVSSSKSGSSASAGRFNGSCSKSGSSGRDERDMGSSSKSGSSGHDRKGLGSCSDSGSSVRTDRLSVWSGHSTKPSRSLALSIETESIPSESDANKSVSILSECSFHDEDDRPSDLSQTSNRIRRPLSSRVESVSSISLSRLSDPLSNTRRSHVSSVKTISNIIPVSGAVQMSSPNDFLSTEIRAQGLFHPSGSTDSSVSTVETISNIPTASEVQTVVDSESVSSESVEKCSLSGHDSTSNENQSSNSKRSHRLVQDEALHQVDIVPVRLTLHDKSSSLKSVSEVSVSQASHVGIASLSDEVFDQVLSHPISSLAQADYEKSENRSLHRTREYDKTTELASSLASSVSSLPGRDGNSVSKHIIETKSHSKAGSKVDLVNTGSVLTSGKNDKSSSVSHTCLHSKQTSVSNKSLRPLSGHDLSSSPEREHVSNGNRSQQSRIYSCVRSEVIRDDPLTLCRSSKAETPAISSIAHTLSPVSSIISTIGSVSEDIIQDCVPGIPEPLDHQLSASSCPRNGLSEAATETQSAVLSPIVCDASTAISVSGTTPSGGDCAKQSRALSKHQSVGEVNKQRIVERSDLSGSRTLEQSNVSSSRTLKQPNATSSRTVTSPVRVLDRQSGNMATPEFSNSPAPHTNVALPNSRLSAYKDTNADQSLEMNLSSILLPSATSVGDNSSAQIHSFNHFKIDMRRQLLQEEHQLSQHRMSLISAQKRRIFQKIKSQLEQLDQQKRQYSSTDSRYSAITKRQQTLMQKMKERLSELNRLKAIARLNWEKRHLILSHYDNLIKQMTESELSDSLSSVNQDLDISSYSPAASADRSLRALEMSASRRSSLLADLQTPMALPGLTRRYRNTSWSDDSVSLNSTAEALSDQSDLEGRIISLEDQLKRRKQEAEHLRREQKRRDKERLRMEEQSLKKQIEIYENRIRETETELETQRALQQSGHAPSVPRPVIGRPTRRRLSLDRTKVESVSPSSSPSAVSVSKSSGLEVAVDSSGCDQKVEVRSRSSGQLTGAVSPFGQQDQVRSPLGQLEEVISPSGHRSEVISPPGQLAKTKSPPQGHQPEVVTTLSSKHIADELSVKDRVVLEVSDRSEKSNSPLLSVSAITLDISGTDSADSADVQEEEEQRVETGADVAEEVESAADIGEDCISPAQSHASSTSVTPGSSSNKSSNNGMFELVGAKASVDPYDRDSSNISPAELKSSASNLVTDDGVRKTIPSSECGVSTERSHAPSRDDKRICLAVNPMRDISLSGISNDNQNVHLESVGFPENIGYDEFIEDEHTEEIDGFRIARSFVEDEKKLVPNAESQSVLDLKPQHQDLDPQHQDLVPQHHDMLPQHQDLLAQHQDSISQHKDLVPQQQDFVYQHQDLVPQHQDLIPERHDSIPERNDMSALDCDPPLPHQDNVCPIVANVSESGGITSSSAITSSEYTHSRTPDKEIKSESYIVVYRASKGSDHVTSSNSDTSSEMVVKETSGISQPTGISEINENGTPVMSRAIDVRDEISVDNLSFSPDRLNVTFTVDTRPSTSSPVVSSEQLPASVKTEAGKQSSNLAETIIQEESVKSKAEQSSDFTEVVSTKRSHELTPIVSDIPSPAKTSESKRCSLDVIEAITAHLLSELLSDTVLFCRPLIMSNCHASRIYSSNSKQVQYGSPAKQRFLPFAATNNTAEDNDSSTSPAHDIQPSYDDDSERLDNEDSRDSEQTMDVELCSEQSASTSPACDRVSDSIMQQLLDDDWQQVQSEEGLNSAISQPVCVRESFGDRRLFSLGLHSDGDAGELSPVWKTQPVFSGDDHCFVNFDMETLEFKEQQIEEELRQLEVLEKLSSGVIYTRQIPNRPPPPYPGSNPVSVENLLPAVPVDTAGLMVLLDSVLAGTETVELSNHCDYFSVSARQQYISFLQCFVEEVTEEERREENEAQKKLRAWQHRVPASLVASLSRGTLRHVTSCHSTQQILHDKVRSRFSKALQMPGDSSMVTASNIGGCHDPVYQFLVQELREERREWLDFSRDVEQLKQKLADQLFGQLIDELAGEVQRVWRCRHVRQTAL